MDALFKFQRLNNQGHALAGSVAKSFDRLLTKLRKKVKANRELAIAEMHLEEACFFVKKAIAVDPDNHYITRKQQKLQQSKKNLTADSADQRGPAKNTKAKS